MTETIKHIEERIKVLKRCYQQSDDNRFNFKLTENEIHEHGVRARIYDWALYELNIVLEKLKNELKTNKGDM